MKRPVKRAPRLPAPAVTGIRRRGTTGRTRERKKTKGGEEKETRRSTTARRPRRFRAIRILNYETSVTTCIPASLRALCL